MKTVITLPDFDTGQYGGATLINSGDATLAINIDEVGTINIKFTKCRYIQFTALYNCTVEMVGSYFRVDEVERSESLRLYIQNDKASLKAYKELHHYRIFLDETGCYEIYSESVGLV